MLGQEKDISKYNNPTFDRIFSVTSFLEINTEQKNTENYR